MKTWKEESEYIQELFNAESNGFYTLQIRDLGEMWANTTEFSLKYKDRLNRAYIVYKEVKHRQGYGLRSLSLSMGNIGYQTMSPEVEVYYTFDARSAVQSRNTVKAALITIRSMDELYDNLKEGIEL